MMMMMSSRGGRYAAFLTALLSALFLVFQQSSYSNSNNVFVAATARLPAASLSNPAIATDGGPRDFTAKARKAWVAATESNNAKKSSSAEEVAQLGAGGNYFVHSSVRRGCSCSCSCSVSFVLLSARFLRDVRGNSTL